MEDVSTGVLGEKEYLRSKDKAKYDMMYQDIYTVAYVKIQKKKIYYPVCQTYREVDI